MVNLLPQQIHHDAVLEAYYHCKQQPVRGMGIPDGPIGIVAGKGAVGSIILQGHYSVKEGQQCLVEAL